jgi:protein O-GlcNAc transferase
MASDIGISPQVVILSWKQLLKRQDGFPLLAHLADGRGVVVVGVRATGAGKIAVLDPRVQPVKVRWMGRQSFCRHWRGEAMLFKPQAISSIQDELIRGIELQQQGQIEEAAQVFRAVLSIDPNHPAALYSLAVIAINDGRPDEALRLTQSGIAISPGFAPLWFAHGSVLQALEHKQEALDAFDAALRYQPDYVEALVNSGVLLRDFHRHHEALERFNRVLTIKPDHTTALANCAILLTEFKQSELAIRRFERLLELQPDYDYGLGLLCYERLHICDWTDYDRLTREIIEGIRAGRRTCKTLALMAICDSAEDHFKAAQIFAAGYCPRKPIALWQGERYQHDRIRIAYVSPDLREHPVGHLMAGVFEHHDKSRFETIAISLGIDDQSHLRARMLKAFDHFIDARLMGSRQIAEKMREMEVDIAIDLAGYTSDSRIEIFAYRPAPVQISYLGYPGTLGTDYIDYIIADRHVIPEDHQPFTARSRSICLMSICPPTAVSSFPSALQHESNADCQKPASFSAPLVTITKSPRYIRRLDAAACSGSKQRTLAHVAQRVIAANLRRGAEQRGIDPSRLIFASRVPRVEDHLARYRQADLFLDTHPYNAHTTAADALMAGLPVITYMGNAFPARVAGSLLHSIGLPELITHSLEEYEALALKLAIPIRNSWRI